MSLQPGKKHYFGPGLWSSAAGAGASRQTRPASLAPSLWVRAQLHGSEQGIARGRAREETRCSSPSLCCKTTSPKAITARGFPKRCPLDGFGCSCWGTSPPRWDSSQSCLLFHPARSRWIFQFSSLDGAGDSTAPRWNSTLPHGPAPRQLLCPSSTPHILYRPLHPRRTHLPPSPLHIPYIPLHIMHPMPAFTPPALPQMLGKPLGHAAWGS